MEIKILGMGCARCKILFQNAQQAVKELGLSVQPEKVEDITQIARYGVMQTPALVINGRVVLADRLAAPEQIKEWISQAEK